MSEVFICSNKDCFAVWSENPNGPCPACKKPNGGGWSTIIRRVQPLPPLTPDDIVDRMVSRFLGWKLPESFNPDGGIAFERIGNAGTQHQYVREPSGTNLLDATQARAMVLHMTEGLLADNKEVIKS